jgi:hypothetical protein
MSTYLNISDKIKLESYAPDPSYSALLSYATTQGYSLPNEQQQVNQDILLKSLKIAGVWDKLDLFYVFATDGDSDYATLNYKSPSDFQLLKVNSPTFTTNQGFKGDASTAKLTTANGGNEYNMITDAINASQDSMTTLCYFNDLGVLADYLYGALQTSPTIGYHQGNGAATRNNSSSNYSAPSISDSFTGMRRNNSANFDVIDGSSFNNRSIASDSVPNTTFGILGRDGSSSGGFASAEISFLIHGGALTNTEIADTKTAIETYMTAL